MYTRAQLGVSEGGSVCWRVCLCVAVPVPVPVSV